MADAAASRSAAAAAHASRKTPRSLSASALTTNNAPESNYPNSVAAPTSIARASSTAASSPAPDKGGKPPSSKRRRAEREGDDAASRSIDGNSGVPPVGSKKDRDASQLQRAKKARRDPGSSAGSSASSREPAPLGFTKRAGLPRRPSGRRTRNSVSAAAAGAAKTPLPGSSLLVSVDFRAPAVDAEFWARLDQLSFPGLQYSDLAALLNAHAAASEAARVTGGGAEFVRTLVARRSPIPAAAGAVGVVPGGISSAGHSALPSSGSGGDHDRSSRISSSGAGSAVVRKLSALPQTPLSDRAAAGASAPAASVRVAGRPSSSVGSKKAVAAPRLIITQHPGVVTATGSLATSSHDASAASSGVCSTHFAGPLSCSCIASICAQPSPSSASSSASAVSASAFSQATAPSASKVGEDRVSLGHGDTAASPLTALLAGSDDAPETAGVCGTSDAPLAAEPDCRAGSSLLSPLAGGDPATEPTGAQRGSSLVGVACSDLDVAAAVASRQAIVLQPGTLLASGSTDAGEAGSSAAPPSSCLSAAVPAEEEGPSSSASASSAAAAEYYNYAVPTADAAATTNTSTAVECDALSGSSNLSASLIPSNISFVPPPLPYATHAPRSRKRARLPSALEQPRSGAAETGGGAAPSAPTSAFPIDDDDDTATAPALAPEPPIGAAAAVAAGNSPSRRGAVLLRRYPSADSGAGHSLSGTPPRSAVAAAKAPTPPPSTGRKGWAGDPILRDAAAKAAVAASVRAVQSRLSHQTSSSSSPQLPTLPAAAAAVAAARDPALKTRTFLPPPEHIMLQQKLLPPLVTRYGVGAFVTKVFLPVIVGDAVEDQVALATAAAAAAEAASPLGPSASVRDSYGAAASPPHATGPGSAPQHSAVRAGEWGLPSGLGAGGLAHRLETLVSAPLPPALRLQHQRPGALAAGSALGCACACAPAPSSAVSGGSPAAAAATVSGGSPAAAAATAAPYSEVGGGSAFSGLRRPSGQFQARGRPQAGAANGPHHESAANPSSSSSLPQSPLLSLQGSPLRTREESPLRPRLRATAGDDPTLHDPQQLGPGGRRWSGSLGAPTGSHPTSGGGRDRYPNGTSASGGSSAPAIGTSAPAIGSSAPAIGTSAAAPRCGRCGTLGYAGALDSWGGAVGEALSEDTRRLAIVGAFNACALAALLERSDAEVGLQSLYGALGRPPPLREASHGALRRVGLGPLVDLLDASVAAAGGGPVGAAGPPSALGEWAGGSAAGHALGAGGASAAAHPHTGPPAPAPTSAAEWLLSGIAPSATLQPQAAHPGTASAQSGPSLTLRLPPRLVTDADGVVLLPRIAPTRRRATGGAHPSAAAEGGSDATADPAAAPAACPVTSPWVSAPPPAAGRSLLRCEAVLENAYWALNGPRADLGLCSQLDEGLHAGNTWRWGAPGEGELGCGAMRDEGTGGTGSASPQATSASGVRWEHALSRGSAVRSTGAVAGPRPSALSGALAGTGAAAPLALDAYERRVWSRARLLRGSAAVPAAASQATGDGETKDGVGSLPLPHPAATPVVGRSTEAHFVRSPGRHPRRGSSGSGSNIQDLPCYTFLPPWIRRGGPRGNAPAAPLASPTSAASGGGPADAAVGVSSSAAAAGAAPSATTVEVTSPSGPPLLAMLTSGPAAVAGGPASSVAQPAASAAAAEGGSCSPSSRLNALLLSAETGAVGAGEGAGAAPVAPQDQGAAPVASSLGSHTDAPVPTSQSAAVAVGGSLPQGPLPPSSSSATGAPTDGPTNGFSSSSSSARPAPLSQRNEAAAPVAPPPIGRRRRGRPARRYTAGDSLDTPSAGPLSKRRRRSIARAVAGGSESGEEGDQAHGGSPTPEGRSEEERPEDEEEARRLRLGNAYLRPLALPFPAAPRLVLGLLQQQQQQPLALLQLQASSMPPPGSHCPPFCTVCRRSALGSNAIANPPSPSAADSASHSGGAAAMTIAPAAAPDPARLGPTLLSLARRALLASAQASSALVLPSLSLDGEATAAGPPFTEEKEPGGGAAAAPSYSSAPGAGKSRAAASGTRGPKQGGATPAAPSAAVGGLRILGGPLVSVQQPTHHQLGPAAGAMAESRELLIAAARLASFCAACVEPASVSGDWAALSTSAAAASGASSSSSRGGGSGGKGVMDRPPSSSLSSARKSGESAGRVSASGAPLTLLSAASRRVLARALDSERDGGRLSLGNTAPARVAHAPTAVLQEPAPADAVCSGCAISLRGLLVGSEARSGGGGSGASGGPSPSFSSALAPTSVGLAQAAPTAASGRGARVKKQRTAGDGTELPLESSTAPPPAANRAGDPDPGLSGVSAELEWFASRVPQGCAVEAKDASGEWGLGVVAAIAADAGCLRRFLCIRYSGWDACTDDWISIADGRVAPIGVHLRSRGVSSRS